MHSFENLYMYIPSQQISLMQYILDTEQGKWKQALDQTVHKPLPALEHKIELNPIKTERKEFI